MVMKMDEGLDTGADRHGGTGADRRRRDHRRLARRARKARRRSDAAIALGALETRQLATDAAAGRRRHLRQQDRQERNAHRLGQALATRSTIIAAGCRRFPARGASLPGAGRVKILRTTKGEGSGPPGRVLDDKLTVACGDRRGAARRNCSAPAASRWPRTNSCAARRSHRQPCCPDMPRYKLTIEYDGTPYVGWQTQDNGPSIQGALTDAIAAFAGERVTVLRRRTHRRRRACARPGRARRSGQELGRRQCARRRSISICVRSRSRC